MAQPPKFLQRIHFSPRVKPDGARPAIVQYHPQATGEFAKRQGYVLAFLEPWAEEHGASLAAGPDALDLLSRILLNRDGTQDPVAFANLLFEARVLVQKSAPPEGSVHPNGTPRTPAEREPQPIRCRYTDCVEQHPVASEDDPVTCPTCRKALGLPKEVK